MTREEPAGAFGCHEGGGETTLLTSPLLTNLTRHSKASAYQYIWHVHLGRIETEIIAQKTSAQYAVDRLRIRATGPGPFAQWTMNSA